MHILIVNLGKEITNCHTKKIAIFFIQFLK